MGRQRSGCVNRSTRLGAAMVAALAVVLCLAITPVLADTAPGGDGGGNLAAAQQALAQAQLQAQQARNQVVEAAAQLDNARAQLAEAQAQLTALQGKITSLDTEVTSDQAEVSRLDGEIQRDKQQLAAFLRASYESGGSQTTIEYLVDAKSISDLVARVNEVSHVANAGNVLVDQINAEEQQEQRVLAATVEARSLAQAAEQQEATQEVIIANDEAEDQATASAADDATTTAQNQYDLVSEYDSEYAAAAEALALARADDTLFQPIAGPLFTEDTDLTLPSGENAQTIDSFLAGTALAGLGATYMQAEKTYGVSARYLVAHSIEESAWGTSAIAQSDNNLFGYGTDDSDPAGDASRFPSFAACILYVAQQVQEKYLAPAGEYYHGPTLRGMNVDYASDPLWAAKIAAIALTIPLPGS